MHSFQISADTDQIPFTLDGFQAAKLELPEPQDVFNDAEHGFDGRFALAVERLCPASIIFSGLTSITLAGFS
jgi:hypothetical protein